MANISLIRPNLSDGGGGIYDVGNEVAAAPASNLLIMQPKIVWETSSLTSLNFSIDLGPGGDAWDTMGIYWTNASASATIQIQRSSSPSAGFVDWKTAGTTFLAPGQSHLSRRHGYWTDSTTQTMRYVKFIISDGSNPDGFFRAGRVFVGKKFQPALNVEYGATLLGMKDLSQVIVTGSGETVTRRSEVLPFLRFTMQHEGTTDETELFGSIHPLLFDVGGSKDLFVIFDSADATYGGLKTVHGLLQPLVEAQAIRFRSWRATYQITSLA